MTDEVVCLAVFKIQGSVKRCKSGDASEIGELGQERQQDPDNYRNLKETTSCTSGYTDLVQV